MPENEIYLYMTYYSEFLVFTTSSSIIFRGALGLNMLNISTLNRWHLHRATIRSDMHLGGLVIYSINNPYHANMMPCPSSWVWIAKDLACVKNM